MRGWDQVVEFGNDAVFAEIEAAVQAHNRIAADLVESAKLAARSRIAASSRVERTVARFLAPLYQRTNRWPIWRWRAPTLYSVDGQDTWLIDRGRRVAKGYGALWALDSLASTEWTDAPRP